MIWQLLRHKEKVYFKFKLGGWATDIYFFNETSACGVSGRISNSPVFTIFPLDFGTGLIKMYQEKLQLQLNYQKGKF